MDEAAAELHGPLRCDLASEAGTKARADRGQPDFDQIVADHQDRIARLVGRLLDGADGVEDVVQDVFLAAFVHLGRFRGDAKLSTWLTRIAVNRCRSRRRRGRLVRQWLPWLAKAAVARDEPVAADETHEEIRRAVGRLPDKYREPIVLRYFEDLSAVEIAEILGVGQAAVEARLSRARRRLREVLAGRLEEK
ncbi:MAG: sigma-70 family RNA polymerase sigma factor [Pirellulales bacterium]|nr:sigma-70 family RNA polymerase sigma factor [Pirellulales bacterium]